MHDLKEKMDGAQIVGIVLPDKPQYEYVLAAFALKKAAGEKGHILGGKSAVNEQWNALYENEKLAPRDFALSLNTGRFPVEELRYERQNDKLVVFFTSHAPIRKEYFHFEETVPECDMVITLGFHNSHEERDALEALFRKGHYEHISLGCGNAGIGSTNSDAPPLKLLARILFRSRKEEELETLWSFISPDDFTKTKASGKDAISSAEAFASVGGSPHFLTLLWQEPAAKGVSGLIRSSDAETLKTLATSFGVAQNSNYILIPLMPNFTEAELTVRKLLKGLRYDTIKE